MTVYEIPLIIFQDLYWDTLIKAQKEIYPTEPESNKEYLNNFKWSTVTFIEDKEKVAGFCVWLSCTEPRTKEGFGTSLWLYVDPSYRNGLVTGKLLKAVERSAKSLGAKYFKWDINKDSALIEAFDKRAEYKKESIIYSKELI